MTAKIYVDTNILVYAHDSTAGAKHQRAREILVDLWKSGQGCLSVQVLQEFFPGCYDPAKRDLDALRRPEQLLPWCQ